MTLRIVTVSEHPSHMVKIEKGMLNTDWKSWRKFRPRI